MKKAFPEYKVNELCAVFNVSPSSYYYHPVEPSEDELQLIELVKSIADESHNTYGKRRIQNSLAKKNHQVGLTKAASLMKKANVIAIKPKAKHYYPDNGEEPLYAPNYLDRQFEQDSHNTHFVGDITYIKTHQGWSYLACVMDLATKEIVGYSMSQSPNAQLAIDALHHALKRQKLDTKQLMFHSDQGCQYSAKSFRDALTTLHIKQSMSRRGNCLDNAVMERFFRSLKTERLNHLSFINHQAAVEQTESYIQFYNYRRIHSSINYMTPHQKYQSMKKEA